MANKIDSMTNQHLQITGRPAARTQAPDGNGPQASKADAAPTARGDTVELTESARKLQALEATLSRVGEVDQSRVDAVRSRIEAGEYQVDAGRVADRMIALDRDLPEGK